MIATALGGDLNVRRHIEMHRRQRSRELHTVEKPCRVAAEVADGVRLPVPPVVIIVEFLTMMMAAILILQDGVVRRDTDSKRVHWRRRRRSLVPLAPIPPRH